ncbi:MAG: transcriptional repressor LexA [Bacteriovoracaceae bacterium]
MALTKKQKEVFDYIQSYTAQNGYSPTQKEIKNHFEFKSFGSVQRYLKYLKEHNLLESDWNARRGIKISDEQTPVSNDIDQNSDFEAIPMLGRVAAGNPIEAIERASESLSVPQNLLKGRGRFFALEVQGDSMWDAGIREGDHLICRHEQTARNGQIVVALVDGEATVKTYQKQKNEIHLLPENADYNPIIVDCHSQFSLAGVVIGLIRNFNV